MAFVEEVVGDNELRDRGVVAEAAELQLEHSGRQVHRHYYVSKGWWEKGGSTLWLPTRCSIMRHFFEEINVQTPN